MNMWREGIHFGCNLLCVSYRSKNAFAKLWIYIINNKCDKDIYFYAALIRLVEVRANHKSKIEIPCCGYEIKAST